MDTDARRLIRLPWRNGRAFKRQARVFIYVHLRLFPDKAK